MSAVTRSKRKRVAPYRLASKRINNSDIKTDMELFSSSLDRVSQKSARDCLDIPMEGKKQQFTSFFHILNS